MKQIILCLLIVLSFCSNAQVSSYNKGIKKNSVVFGEWYLNKGIETFVTQQNPVGYKQSYDELKKILSYYELNIMESEVDDSLLSNIVESLYDFQNVSNSLKIEWSSINMVWRADDIFQINWICKAEINLILIQKI
jgi:hypothetical protein